MSLVAISHEPYHVIRVDTQHVDAILPAIKPLLEKSVPYTEGFQTVDEMYETLKSGARPWQLWVIVDSYSGGAFVGSFITSLEYAGNQRAFNFEIIAGINAQSWITPLIHKFEEYMAYMYDCTYARIIGRKGWEKFLARHGYKATHFVTAKKLVETKEIPFAPTDLLQQELFV